MSQGQQVLEHISAHILHDPHIAKSIPPCGLSLHLAPLCQYFVKSKGASGKPRFALFGGTSSRFISKKSIWMFCSKNMCTYGHFSISKKQRWRISGKYDEMIQKTKTPSSCHIRRPLHWHSWRVFFPKNDLLVREGHTKHFQSCSCGIAKPWGWLGHARVEWHQFRPSHWRSWRVCLLKNNLLALEWLTNLLQSCSHHKITRTWERLRQAGNFKFWRRGEGQDR